MKGEKKCHTHIKRSHILLTVARFMIIIMRIIRLQSHQFIMKLPRTRIHRLDIETVVCRWWNIEWMPGINIFHHYSSKELMYPRNHITEAWNILFPIQNRIVVDLDWTVYHVCSTIICNNQRFFSFSALMTECVFVWWSILFINGYTIFKWYDSWYWIRFAFNE